MKGSHTSESISYTVLEVHKKHKITDRVFYAGTDNRRNMRKAFCDMMPGFEVPPGMYDEVLDSVVGTPDEHDEGSAGMENLNGGRAVERHFF